MRGRPRTDAAVDLGQHGSWRFTAETVVEPELILLFHSLYEAAFGPLRTRAMARQVLTAEEFGTQLANGDVLKYVAWTPEGEPVGMAALTNNLSTVPWISPEYFEARYPEQWSRGAVWYFNFVLAHPSQRHSRFIDQMIEVGVGELVRQGAVCGYDICAFNADVLGLAQRAAEVFQRTTGTVPVRADTQNYYTLEFDRPAAERPRTADDPGSAGRL